MPVSSGWDAFLRTCFQSGKFLPPGDSIRSVHAVVEPDFSNEGFGHPDAVLRFDFDSGTQCVVILEAKRLPYLKCTASPSLRSGAGYNSTLNGQMELNHCLALALSSFQDASPLLTEPEWILHSPYASERRGRLRCLKNPAVIDDIVKPLAGLPFQSFLHLVITTDSSDPLDNPACAAFWPELYHPDYPFQNCWTHLRERYAWTSWARIESFFRMIDPETPRQPPLFLATLEKNRQNFKSGIGTIEESTTSRLELTQHLPFKAATGVVLACDAEANGEYITGDPQLLAASVPESGAPSAGRRGGRGASMIYAPSINSNTFIHFSWLNESCALRDYSTSPNIMPLEDRERRTSEVVAQIAREIVVRKRAPISDHKSWHETTTELNRTELARLKTQSADETVDAARNPLEG